MAEESQNTDLSFLDDDSSSFLHVKDVLMTILRNLHWFLLCAVAGGFIAHYQVSKQDRIYASSAKIAIKSITTENTSREIPYMSSIASRRVPLGYSTINSEILTMKSKTTMLEVIDRLDLATIYKAKTKMVKRSYDLYGEEPVIVNFLDITPKAYHSFVVIPKKDSLYLLREGEASAKKYHFGDTVNTSVGRIVVNPTWYLSDNFIDEEITVKHVNVEDYADDLRGRLSISRNEPTDAVINISLQDPSAKRAADVINTVISVYNDIAVNEKKRIIAETYDFINDRIMTIDADLSRQERQLAQFKKSNKIIDIESYGQRFMNADAKSTEDIATISKQIELTNYIKGIVAQGPGIMLPASIGIENSEIERMVAEYNVTTSLIEKYESSGMTNNPVVKNLKTEQESSLESLSRVLDVYLVTLKANLSGAQSASELATSQISMAPEQQLYIGGVERLQKIKEEIYLTLISKREELLISQPSIEPNAKIIDEARVDKTVVSPIEKKSVTNGILLGLLVPVLLFLLGKILDTRVKYREDVEKATKTPIIGEVPSNVANKKRWRIKNQWRKLWSVITKKEYHPEEDKNTVVVQKHSRDQISEAFRIIRSNLSYFNDPYRTSNVIMFTSLVESSGKTFLSTNIAASLALTHKKVIVIDLDLRKCTLTNDFSTTKNKGLSDYLSGKEKNFESLIEKNVIAPGVDAIFSGAIPPNPAELLSSKKLENLVSDLRDMYEYVILDCIPVSILADADIVKRLADATALVIRARHFDKRMLVDVDKLYKSNAFPKMGIILNDVENPKKTYFGYGYGYGYGYGQGYGYGYGRSYGYEYGEYGSTEKDKNNE